MQHWGDPNRPSTNGPVHTAELSDAKGCGLAIAYTDDVYSLKPEDFTVFSVNHTCVWYKETYFDIPDDMPPCPDGKKCICSWNWIHGNRRNQGYGNELYSEFELSLYPLSSFLHCFLPSLALPPSHNLDFPAFPLVICHELVHSSSLGSCSFPSIGNYLAYSTISPFPLPIYLNYYTSW